MLRTTSGAHKATQQEGPGPAERSIREAPNFAREGARPGEPHTAPLLASPLPDSVTVPPHNELLFSILESRDCSSLRFGLC